MLENTTKNVANKAEFQYVGFWRRVVAHVKDNILLAVFFLALGFVIAYAIVTLTGHPARFVVYGTVEIYYFLLLFGSPFVIITFWVKKQATPGKMSIPAIIVDAKTGGIPSHGQYITRYLVYWFPLIFLEWFYSLPLEANSNPISLILYLLWASFFLWMAFDKRKQGLHDKLAGTVVVFHNKKASEATGREKA